MMKERILFLDMLRLLACLMVITMHAPLPGQGADGLVLSSISYFTAPCIGLFFMVSGALLLPVPEHEDTFTFVRKRLTRVVGPTLCWTLFYMMTYSGFSVTTFLSVPFSAQGHRFLWFMYTLVGLYLLAPILSAWLRHASAKEQLFYLSLWGISLCYPLLEQVVIINQTATGILYYFTGYAGYFLLGYFLKNHGEYIKMGYAAALFVVAACVPVFVKLSGMEVNFYRVFWYQSVFVVLMCLFWWKAAQWLAGRITLPDSVTRWVILISNLSFGIYLSHLYFMRGVLWELDIIRSIDSCLLQTAVIVGLTFLLSFLASWLLAFLPKSQYLVGYHHKRR